MTFIELSENEMLHIEKVDSQHLKIVDLFNKLHKELGAKFEGESQRLLADLKIALREHFDTEEELMKKYNYVNYFSHKLEHDRYYKKVDEYLNSVSNSEIKLDLEFLQSGKRWFFNHFELNDKKCGEFLKVNGVD